MSHPFKSPPMEHQRSGLKRAWKRTEFALFWEMGTGKTFTAINLAAGRFIKGQINGMIVICPTPIKAVWESEFEKWCPVDYDLVVLEASATSRKAAKAMTNGEDRGRLRVLVVGIEALSQGIAHKIAEDFAVELRCMTALDESSRIKNADSARTKRAVKIGRLSLFRLIMTGTPITQGIEDLYGQFLFLNPQIMACRNYWVFKNRYCLMGGFENRKIVGYQNSQELLGRVSSYIDVVKKEDVLDLPPKLYTKIKVDPTKEQLKLIDSLVETFMAEHDGDTLSTETVLERLTRFQQIIGGFFPYDDDLTLDSQGRPVKTYGIKPIEGKNPKLEAMLEYIADLPNDAKVIIWCRFNPESDLIVQTLRDQYGDESTVTFVGSDGPEERKANVQAFTKGDSRFMVSKPQLGGMGQTWVEATYTIYYSNSFSYEDRKQSEDRNHRKGQENHVTYLDIEANHKYDQMILAAIEKKGDIAEYVDENIQARNEQ